MAILNNYELMLNSEIFVIGNGTKEFADIINRTDEASTIIDLVRFKNAPIETRASYSGLCW
jgi:hypothetical protein